MPKTEKIKTRQFTMKLSPLETVRMFELSQATQGKKSKFFIEILKYFWNMAEKGPDNPEDIKRAEALLEYIGKRTENDLDRTKIPISKVIEIKKEFDSMYRTNKPVKEIETKLDIKFNLKPVKT